MAEQLEYKLEPSCKYGFTRDDLEKIFNPQELKLFYKWMTGQTVSLCDGKRFKYRMGHNEECGHAEGDDFTYECSYLPGGWSEATACSGLPEGTRVDNDAVLKGHGPVTYRFDVERYIEGGFAKAYFD
jgi:hypothetical protein